MSAVPVTTPTTVTAPPTECILPFLLAIQHGLHCNFHPYKDWTRAIGTLINGFALQRAEAQTPEAAHAASWSLLSLITEIEKTYGSESMGDGHYVLKTLKRILEAEADLNQPPQCSESAHEQADFWGDTVLAVRDLQPKLPNFTTIYLHSLKYGVCCIRFA